MTLKSVVLPAPLGPISPVTQPGSAVRSTPLTATLPRKRTVTASTESWATSAHRPGQRLECLVHLADVGGGERAGDADPLERERLRLRDILGPAVAQVQRELRTQHEQAELDDRERIVLDRPRRAEQVDDHHGDGRQRDGALLLPH